MPKPKVEQPEGDEPEKDQDIETPVDGDQDADQPAEKPAVVGRGRNTAARVAPAEDSAPAETERDITEIWTNRARETQKELEAQPKVRIMIPLKDGEAAGSVQEFNINGYRIAVRKNVMVDVPEQIAEMIMERYQIEATAGQGIRIDRPKAGLSEALS